MIIRIVGRGFLRGEIYNQLEIQTKHIWRYLDSVTQYGAGETACSVIYSVIFAAFSALMLLTSAMTR